MNPRPCGLAPEASALDHSAKLSMLYTEEMRNLCVLKKGGSGAVANMLWHLVPRRGLSSTHPRTSLLGFSLSRASRGVWCLGVGCDGRLRGTWCHGVGCPALTHEPPFWDFHCPGPPVAPGATAWAVMAAFVAPGATAWVVKHPPTNLPTGVIIVLCERVSK